MKLVTLPPSMRSHVFLGLIVALVIGHSSLITPYAQAQEIPPILPPGVAKLPSVRLLSLGGTISGTAKERLNITNYGAPRLSPKDWVDALPDLALFARVTPEDIRPPGPDGGDGDETHWLKVAKRLQELATDDSVEGIVITHGTNTMVETGYFLSLVVNIKKPVVFVGAQRPWTGLSGDGPLNLLNAVRVAATPAAGGKGVLHAMNQNVYPIRDVTKTSAYRVDTFRGIDLGVIGVADPDIVRFYTEPIRRHTYKSEFNIASLPAVLPSVEIVYGYNGTPGYIVDAMVAQGVKGIVVDGPGAGSIPNTMTEAIKRAQAAGVVVVATARTHGGRVQETQRRTEAKIVPSDNLPPEKARILLKLALTKTTDLAEIKRIFDQY
jgi:L-asparaginase